MADMIVSGAGGAGAEVNGTYYENGTMFDTLLYSGPNDINNYGGIYRNGGIWFICSDFESAPEYKSVESGLASPDLVTTWIPYTFEGFWEDYLPVPTVTAAGGPPQNLTDYIVANCETAELNGTYVRDTYLGFGDYYWLLFDGNGFGYENLVGVLFSDECQFPCVNLFSFDMSIQYGDGNYNPHPTLPDDPSISWVDLFTYIPSALTVTAAPSPQNLTLTCAAGSYSLTGTSVTLTHTPASQNLTLTCNAGSYSLTGTNADLTVTRHYTLICEAGSYALTGTNADLTVKRNYVLNAVYPDMIVSGAENSAANGTYAQSSETHFGRPVYYYTDGSLYYEIRWYQTYWALLELPIMDFHYVCYEDVATPDLCSSWIDSYTSEPSSLTVTAANAYKLTGTDATLTVQRNYTLVCEPGSYTLTGTDITFGNSKAYTLTCEAGSYDLTGSDISFAIQRNYSLACETGSYSLTGTDVTLTYTQGAQNFTLACETGSYALTGTNAGLTSARTMACSAGSYTLTGTNADFYRALVMACEAGSYALTGTDATFNANYVFALGMGSYVLVGTACGLFILSPTPACRTATIEYENRTFAIPHENRTATIEYENRTLEVKCH